MMTFHIYAVTSREYGLFICSTADTHVSAIITALHLECPTWDFLAFAATNKKDAIGRNDPHEQNPEGSHWLRPTAGRPSSKRRNREGGRWKENVFRAGTEPALKEIPAQTLCPLAHRFGSRRTQVGEIEAPAA